MNNLMINDLPEELFFVILRKCNVKDMIIMTSVCKHYNKIIDVGNEMKEKCDGKDLHIDYVYGKLSYKDLYLEYTHGKSFRNIDDIPEDVSFKVPENSYILLSFDRIIYKTSSINIIIINNDNTYMEYEFEEVLHPDTINPSNYGYDNDDYYKYRLIRQNNCYSLEELFLCLPYGAQQKFLEIL